jgi:CDP-diglyceride synthetase
MTLISDKWGNGDPDFNKIVKKLFGSDSAKTRKTVFYTICIVFRLYLYILSASYVQYNAVVIFILVCAIFAAYNLYTNIASNLQWWSKKFQLVISLCLIFACSLSLLYSPDIFNRKIISAILLFSLFGGIVQSLFNS